MQVTTKKLIIKVVTNGIMILANIIAGMKGVKDENE